MDLLWRTSHLRRPWLRKYQTGVPAILQIPPVPVTRVLDDTADRCPHRTALIFGRRRISYAQLRQSVDRFASGLRRLGVRSGDRVALVLPNCPQFVIAFFGTLRIGAIAVAHNPLYAEAEMAHQLGDCGAKVAVIVLESRPTVRSVRRYVPLEHVIVTSLKDYLPDPGPLTLKSPPRERRRPELEGPPEPGELDFMELLRTSPRHIRQAEIDPARDLAILQYTGGIETRPKGVMLTHRNLVANAHQARAWYPDRRDGKEVTLAVAPLFHSFGMALCLTFPLLIGSTIVLLPHFGTDEVIEALRRHRPTIFPGIPPLFQRILDSPRLRARDLRSLRACVTSGMSLRRETVERFGQLSSGHLVQAYGLTEAAPSVMCNPLDGNDRLMSVGLPLPNTDAVVVDGADPTKILPPGQAGELVIRGPQIFQGYWQQPKETAKALSKGWLRTGDIAVMSPDGFFTIVEQHRDMIKAGGFSVFPTEVEDVLCRHPMVLDCGVIGLPDERLGERIAACVVMQPAYPFSADELRRHCFKYLTHYKVPHEFFLRNELPRTVLGDLQRHVLREEYSSSIRS